MRPRSQVRQQLRQVTFRHLQKQLRDNFKQKPSTCKHNREILLNDGSVRVCGHLNPEGHPRHVVCDARVAGCKEMARSCPLWAPLKTKEEIKETFGLLLQSDRGEIAAKYPDIAALLWVLDSEEDVPSSEDLARVEPEEGVSLPPSSWWSGLLKKWGAQN